MNILLNQLEETRIEGPKDDENNLDAFTVMDEHGENIYNRKSKIYAKVNLNQFVNK